MVIDPPELETRAAVLLNKASSMGVSMPNDCAIYIAQRIRSNIRELEGALKRVVANARFTNQEIDLGLVKDALKDLFVISAKMVSIENIQKTTAEYYNIKLSDLLSKEEVGRLPDQDKWQWPSQNNLQIIAFQKLEKLLMGETTPQFYMHVRK